MLHPLSNSNYLLGLHYAVFCNALAASAFRPSICRGTEGSPTDATNFVVPP
jgi:hypothetical protein